MKFIKLTMFGGADTRIIIPAQRIRIITENVSHDGKEYRCVEFIDNQISIPVLENISEIMERLK